MGIYSGNSDTMATDDDLMMDDWKTGWDDPNPDEMMGTDPGDEPGGPLPEGITKKRVKKGSGWKQPTKGDEVKVLLSCKLSDGTEVESRMDALDPVHFSVGSAPCKGLNKVIAEMYKDERSIYTFEPKWGFGKEGKPPSVPGNETLTYEVELLEWFEVRTYPEGTVGVTKKRLVETEKWQSPGENEEIAITLRGCLEDGTVFDNAHEFEELICQVADLPCKGLVLAVQDMKVGERSLVTCTPEYAFGEEGDSGRGVPAKSTVTYDVKLKLIREKKDVSCFKDGSVMKTVVCEGTGHNYPINGSTVQIKLKVTSADNKCLFSNTDSDETLNLTVGDLRHSEALEWSVMKMKKGERCEVNTMEQWAADETLQISAQPVQLEVQLESFEKAKESWEMDNDEKLVASETIRAAGTQLFKRQKLLAAIDKYKLVTGMWEHTGEDSVEEGQKEPRQQAQLLCELNLAACYLKLKEPQTAIQHCNNALKVDPNSVKALYRKGEAHITLADWLEAKAQFTRVLNIEPNNTDARRGLQRAKKGAAEQDAKDKKVFAKMFDK